MSRGKSALMREYRKVLNEVMRRISKLESEGYHIPEHVKPKLKPLEKVTRREIERLKKYKETYIKRMRGTKYKTREGRMVSGKKGEEIQRSEAAKKGWRERRWREEVNRTETIRLGDALIDSIRREIEEGLGQIPLIKDAEIRQGYWSRCLLIRGTLDTEDENDPDGLRVRLGRVNQSEAVERTQIACRYDQGASDSEAWSAALYMLQLIRGRQFTIQELKQMEEGDIDEFFEEY